MHTRWTIAGLVLAALATSAIWRTASVHGQVAVHNQGFIPYSDEPIHYRGQDLDDPVARLQKRLDAGMAHLEWNEKGGYLQSVLRELRVPSNSQTLVFSKTSFQYKKISPQAPRALYFNDDVYVGFVKNGHVLEVVSFDPRKGAIFYLLQAEEHDHPVFERAELDCTECHIAEGTRGVPDMLVRSVYPTITGTQVEYTASYATGQESSLKERCPCSACRRVFQSLEETMRRKLALLAGTAALVLSLGPASAQTVNDVQGRWDAALALNQNIVPFRLDVSGTGSSIVGTLYNGDDTQTTTSARFEDGKLTLSFDHYLTRIVVSPANGQLAGTLEGRFEREKYLSSYPLTATRHVGAAAAVPANLPQIGGTWEIEYESAKGEKAWRFIVKQNGADLSAAILRVDGDTGALTGKWQDGKFVLSHFDGSRPLVAEVTPQSDGTLSILLKGAYNPTELLIAYRSEVARAKGLPEPADFDKHTTVRDANEKFSFNFPGIDGKSVSSGDAQFKNHVYLAIVTGTWCPNCHDEAQYLVQLYAKYHSRGLEIVALDFEEPEQQDNLHRAKAFIRKYNVPYTYVIAGAPAEMWEKVPQAVNLNTWPATIFVGKDGRVRKIHTGFAAPASGQFNDELKAEFDAEVEALLSEVPPQTVASNTSDKGGN